jgi:hypothetical protein
MNPGQVVVALSFVALLGVAGCSTGDNTLSPPSDQRPCRPGTGAPISELLLRRTLSANGFGEIRRDHGYCFNDPRKLSAVVSNRALIACSVYGKSYGRRIYRYVWRNDPSPTYIGVLNVSCTVGNPRDVTNLLEKALRELPGVSTKPAYVPSPDAQPD